MNADTLKLQRDGHLYFGKPDRWRQQVEACIANGHRGHGHVEYADGTFKCMGCFVNFRVSVPRPDLAAETGGR